MSMSRKNYIAVAAVLRAEYEINQPSHPDAQTAVENITASLADVFAQDNPSFDRKRFYTAALGRETVRWEQPLFTVVGSAVYDAATDTLS